MFICVCLFVFFSCNPPTHTRDAKQQTPVFVLDRRKAPQVSHLRESVQPEFEPDHAHAQAHRVQAVRVRLLRPRLPAQGRPEAAQGVAAQREADLTDVRFGKTFFDAAEWVAGPRTTQKGQGASRALLKRVAGSGPVFKELVITHFDANRKFCVVQILRASCVTIAAGNTEKGLLDFFPCRCAVDFCRDVENCRPAEQGIRSRKTW